MSLAQDKSTKNFLSFKQEFDSNSNRRYLPNLDFIRFIAMYAVLDIEYTPSLVRIFYILLS
ncbi:hypothetical protein TPHV1_80103 [Treponema phagedenis]|uniref:Uncharacterized protein n=1 Tax=Treponema phagedenis TaxID=162 RepID=A0A0B7H277_TREPH|nr:hypothetical protein TPHV1_80103 [Treponema phagedenis]